MTTVYFHIHRDVMPMTTNSDLCCVMMSCGAIVWWWGLIKFSLMNIKNLKRSNWIHWPLFKDFRVSLIWESLCSGDKNQLSHFFFTSSDFAELCCNSLPNVSWRPQFNSDSSKVPFCDRAICQPRHTAVRRVHNSNNHCCYFSWVYVSFDSCEET